MSTSPERTSGRSSSSSRKPWLVVPPSTTTIVSASAQRRRASASSRSLPQAMTLAIIESNSAGMTSPSATPVSTRTPGPVGRRSRAIRPGAGRKPSAGSSALSRASTAWPVGRRRLAFQPPAGGDVELQLDEVEPGDRLGDGVLDLQPRVDLHEREAAASRARRGTRPCRRCGSRRAAPAAAPRPGPRAPARA